MFAFPRSFFCWTRLLRCACFFVDDAPKERLYDSLLFFFFLSSLLLLLLLLCSNNSSSSATTTTTINYKMIKSTQSIRIASFFSFFFFLLLLHPTTVLVRWSLRWYIYIYTCLACICVFLSWYEIADPNVHFCIQGHSQSRLFFVRTHVTHKTTTTMTTTRSTRVDMWLLF